MINLSALFTLKRSKILGSLLDSLFLADWQLLCSLPLVFSLSNSLILWETFSSSFGLYQKLSRDHQFLLKFFIFFVKLMTSLRESVNGVHVNYKLLPLFSELVRILKSHTGNSNWRSMHTNLWTMHIKRTLRHSEINNSIWRRS